MFATSLALLAQAFRGRDRGIAFGAWGAVTGVAVAVGPVLGGVITSGLSWRWIFLVNVPIGALAIALTLLRVDESRDPNPRRPDYLGVVTFSGALGALVYALIKSGTKGWGSAVIVACLAGAAVLFVVFLIVERLQERPMFDLSLFRKPTFDGGSIAAFALSAGLFSLLLYITLYFQDVLGYSAAQTGVRLVVLSGGILLTSTLAGRLTAIVPTRLLIAPGLALVGAGLLLMRGLDASSGWTHLIPGFIVAGIGTGLVNPPLASTAVGVVEPARAGMASGINSTFRQVGIATGIAALGSIFVHTVRNTIVSGLAGAPGLTPASVHALAGTVASGSGGAEAAVSSAPPAARPAIGHAVRTGFTSGLDDVFLVGAILVLVAAVLTLVLIRGKDFHHESAQAGRGERPRAAGQPDVAEQADLASAAGEQPEPRAEPAIAQQAPAVVPPATNGRRALIEGSHEAVALAAEQAASDYGRLIEHGIEQERRRIEALSEAEAQRVRSAGAARAAAYVAEQRARLAALADERVRLAETLRQQVGSPELAEEAAATRRRLYGVIGALGRLADEAAYGERSAEPGTERVPR